MTVPETLFTIGENSYNRLSSYASLDNEEICPESFEKLSQLPCLTTLNLIGSGNIDLTGIEKLEKLKRLDISAKSSVIIRWGNKYIQKTRENLTKKANCILVKFVI